MAISKLILNGDVQMDVTSDTVSASRLLNGYTATKNDGTKVTGNIATKSAADMTTSGSTVTAAAGYYAAATSKNVGAGSAFTPAVTITKNPTISLTSSTGAVTASYAGSSSVTPTVTAGYVAAGTAGTVSTSGTSTYQLTSKAAATYNTSTADQTVGSYQWLTGTQTIKSVTTSNLTAGNIANGVVVKVGDANNASRITQVTGTYAPATSSLTVTPTETQQTFNATGVYGYKPVTVNGISSTYVGTGVTRRDGEDTTFTNSTGAFYGPSGYYTESFTRTITTQAAQTIYPSTADQTVASYKWLTGTQTIKSVTTSNLTAANVAEGVVVKVGDASNASRIKQVTGTYAPNPSVQYYKATFLNDYSGYISYNSSNYSSSGDVFYFKQGDIIHCYFNGFTSVYRDGALAGTGTHISFTAPAKPLDFYYSDAAYINSPTLSISENGIYDVASYASANVSVPFYDIYKAMATIGILNSQGDTRSNSLYSFTYTSTDIQNFCNSLSSIHSNMFVNKYLSDVFTFNNVSVIYNSAFASVGSGNATMTATTILNFPSCINIYDSAFFNNIRLLSVSFPICTTIRSSAFQYCRGLLEANFSSCVSIRRNAFYFCDNLITASFPACTTIEDYAFYSCYNLTTINFSVCTSIGTNAFAYCSNLTTVSFPVCTTISNYAFYLCKSLTTASFPACTKIGPYAFVSCSSLTSINCSSCTSIGTSAFAYCSNLTIASFPACTSIGNYAFNWCTSLATIYFPSCTTISTNAFYSCRVLTEASFSACGLICSSAFQYCYHLISLNLTGVSSVPTLSSTNAFQSTPLYNYSTSAGQWGSIYVPSSLYASFQTATNWSNASIKARLVSV